MKLKLKRAYEDSSPSDGTRILVDRIWPRGLTKEKAKIDVWLKDIAPSTELRKWYNHETDKWLEFKNKYKLELRSNTKAVLKLKDYLKNGPVTLVYGASDQAHNQAVVIKEYIERK